MYIIHITVKLIMCISNKTSLLKGKLVHNLICTAGLQRVEWPRLIGNVSHVGRNLIPGLERNFEYIRDTAVVNIIDSDRKCPFHFTMSI